MKQQLIKDYLLSTNGPYATDFNIDDIQCAGEWVMFDVRAVCGNYLDSSQVLMLDLIAWVYAQ